MNVQENSVVNLQQRKNGIVLYVTPVASLT
jgi:hypothetical protein